MEDSASFDEQELEALKSIYLKEIEIKHDEEKSTSISIDLHPATADNHDEQYVRMTLKFILNEEYPQAVPGISIRNPRGLSEEKLNSIMQNLTSIAEGKTGSSMLFEIIEAAKEHLTNENRPCGECAICLYGFSEDDVFTKTECYHYFHSHCLARHVKNAAISESNDETTDTPDKKILCPMCRLPIHFEGSVELYPPPSAKDDEFIIDEEVLALQKKMADLYQKQLNKGGIIDIEAEKNKYLLEISNVPTRVEKSSPSSTVDDTDSIPEADPSSKTDDNACGDSQSLPKNKVSGNKDSRTDYRSKDKPDNRPRNDKYGYNKYPRNNYNHNNSYRGNQRYNRYPKPNTQNFNRKSNNHFAEEEFDYADEHYTDDEKYSPRNKHKSAVEDCSAGSHDTSPVSESSPGFRSSDPQRRGGRSEFSDSKKYFNGRRGNDYRPNSNWDRRHGPNDYEKRGYRGNQKGTKNSPSKNYSPSKNDLQNDEVIDESISVLDSNALENSSESVSEKTVVSTLAEKQEGDKNFKKMQENRPRYWNSQNRKNSYRNGDFDANYPDDNSQSQEGRKDSFRRGKSGRGFRNNYNDRQPYWENNYHSQGNRYSQENSHKRNFNQQSHQGDRHSQEKTPFNYEDRRDYNKYRSNDRSTHDASNRKFSSDDRYEHHERENNPQGNISRKPSYRNYREEEINDVESSYTEKGNRYNDRNRNNSHYQNRDQNSRGNQNRYDGYNSYQNNRNANRRNAPRKYSDNSESHYYKGDERTKSQSQANAESTNDVNEKQFSTSSSEKVSVPKTDVSKSVASEVPLKETNVPDKKTPVSDTTGDVIPRKMLMPPPGFNNPLKKVVYGLQAANPPPGFPRS